MRWKINIFCVSISNLVMETSITMETFKFFSWVINSINKHWNATKYKKDNNIKFLFLRFGNHPSLSYISYRRASCLIMVYSPACGSKHWLYLPRSMFLEILGSWLRGIKSRILCPNKMPFKYENKVKAYVLKKKYN